MINKIHIKLKSYKNSSNNYKQKLKIYFINKPVMLSLLLKKSKNLLFLQ